MDSNVENKEALTDLLDRGDTGVQLLLQVINNCHAPITITDHQAEDEPIIYCNKAFEELTGYNHDEIIGQNCRFLQGEVTDRDTVAELAKALKDDESVEVTLLNYRKDGSSFWNHLMMEPVTIDGKVTHFLGMQNNRGDTEAEEDPS